MAEAGAPAASIAVESSGDGAHSVGLEGSTSFSFRKQEWGDKSPFRLKSARENFTKWGLNMLACRFGFSGRFEEGSAAALVTDLLNDAGVRGELMAEAGACGNPRSPIAYLSGQVTGVELQRLACTHTTMQLFDALKRDGLVADTGYIRKCMEETFAGVTVADLVREMLANPDSENAHVFTAEEQREFLFHVFARLATGGGACQWEDEIQPYLDAARDVYKELVAVYRSARTGDLQVGSVVYQITSAHGCALFPMGDDGEGERSFCYVVVDTRNKRVALWYNAFRSFWG